MVAGICTPAICFRWVQFFSMISFDVDILKSYPFSSAHRWMTGLAW